MRRNRSGIMKGYDHTLIAPDQITIAEYYF